MKKMVKTLLCLMMALAMSLSLAVPAFAASTVSKETCSHNTGGSYVGQVRTAEPHGDPTTYHRVYTSNRFYCSTCKKYYTVHASESYSNHTLANPAKHTYTRAVYYSVCGQLKSRDTVFAGCTAAGCRLTQRVDPVPVAA